MSGDLRCRTFEQKQRQGRHKYTNKTDRCVQADLFYPSGALVPSSSFCLLGMVDSNRVTAIRLVTTCPLLCPLFSATPHLTSEQRQYVFTLPPCPLIVRR